MRASQQLGQWGEQAAAAFLQRQGMQILLRNYRTAYGEIDIVACEKGELVFVEVKTRSGFQFGSPEEAVTLRKQQHLQKAAELYLAEQGRDEDTAFRFDVIAIVKSRGQMPLIKHIRSAF